MDETLQNNIEKSKNVLNHLIKWLIGQQNIDGGIPPYPDPQAPASVLESGVIASSDTLNALLRPFYSPNGQKCLPDKFVSSWKQTNIIIRQKEYNLETAIKRLISFLLKTQLEDGGFPPLGDVYGIREIGFTDATASSLLALISAYRLNDIIYENETKDIIKSRIKEAIFKSVDWLINNIKYNENIPYWYSTNKKDEKEIRMFPTILSYIALNLYKDCSNEGIFEMKTATKEKINSILSAASEYMFTELANRKYITFNLSENNDVSFINTMLAIDFLLSRFANYESKDDKEKIIKASYNCFQKIVEKWKEVKEKVPNRYDTELDHIELIPLQDPTLPRSYDATYARRPSLLMCTLTLLENLIDENEKEELEKFLNQEISTLLEILSKQPYYCEFRGRHTPASSATAICISFFRKILKIYKIDYSLSNRKEGTK